MTKKAIFLDRDGTLIKDKIYLNDPKDIAYLPGVFAGMKLLADAGYDFVVVTNQSGIPRGLVTETNLHAIHKCMTDDFSVKNIVVNKFYFAPYMPETDHFERKPNPGMLLRGLRDHQYHAPSCWMIGDRMTDVEAGHRAGLRSILLTGTEIPEDFPQYKYPEAVADNFLEAVQFILSCE